MRQMGIAALGPKPRTTKPAPGHKIYPYLLRNMVIERPNHVWAADITYIPTGRGFLYLVAIIDWTSRAVLAWRLDGRGRWIDNVFIERLWRSLKYEDIYLKGYADGREAKAGIGEWLTFYNHRRPHQALANRPPMAIWRDGAGGALGKQAVDMTPRAVARGLDNAGALPTYPQPPQQQILVA